MGGFLSPTFIPFGKCYAGARDYYGYIYGNAITSVEGPGSWNVQVPDKISLFRVPKTSLSNKSAYEYFTGLAASNNLCWSTSSAARKPVFSDGIAGIMRTSVSNKAGLGRYLLTTQHASKEQCDAGRTGSA